MSAQLTPHRRTADLAAMAAPAGVDVLVIGGGVTGAGIALDAASRGLRTAIVEMQDWGSGTSSRSSKLVHGGLRYLQMLDFSLVHEALNERDLLFSSLAPHLVKPVKFLYPLENRAWERAYVGAGITLYDALARIGGKARRALPIHRHLTHGGLLETFPDLKPDAAVGAIEYSDATVDDARLVLTLVRTAAQYGALAANRTQVVEMTTGALGNVTGAVVEDLETGDRHTIKAAHVINATGVWTERTEALSGAEGGLKVLASKGIHIVVPRERISGSTGLILQTEKSVLFVIPWSRYWIIGTTDTPYDFDPTHPVVTAQDIDYLLEHANDVLQRELTRDDIVGTWAGLRPLLQPGTKEGTSSSKASREHTVASPVPGLTEIAGGKLTTYRVMAQDAVDFALGERAEALPSVTHVTPLWGAVGLEATERRMRLLAAEHGWTDWQISHLLHRYGSGVADLVDQIAERPDLAQPLRHAPAYLRAEIHYAATHEGVLHLEDVMLLRTRLDYETADAGRTASVEIAEIVGEVLGWDDDRREAEIAAWAARADAEDAAAREQSDEAAVAARAQAADIAPMVAVHGAATA